MANPLLFEEIPLKEALRKYEKLIIETAIQKHGSQDEVAKILKVDQGTISRKIRKYSLSKKDAEVHKQMQLCIVFKYLYLNDFNYFLS